MSYVPLAIFAVQLLYISSRPFKTQITYSISLCCLITSTVPQTLHLTVQEQPELPKDFEIILYQFFYSV